MSEERRRYFRVQDTIELGYRPLGEEEMQDPESLLGKGELLESVEKELAMLLIQMQARHPDVIRALELMNRKIDIIHHSVDRNSRLDMTSEYEIRHVDISGCGAAFPVGEHFEPGDHILLQVNLPAPFRSVRAVAKVVSCKALANPTGYFNDMIRVEFAHILDKDQELLIQYLMKRQVLELKARREARERKM